MISTLISKSTIYSLSDLKNTTNELLKEFGNLDIRGDYSCETSTIKVWKEHETEEIYVEIVSEEEEEDE